MDADLKAVVEGTPGAVDAKMNDLRVADAMTEIFSLFKRCNKYIDETMPWALAKEEGKKDRLETVLYNLQESIRAGAGLLAPFMPDTAEKILSQIGDGKVAEKPEILFISCEAVPKSKKLLCSQVRVGSQVRQIVSGIRKNYSPEEMVGKKVMVVTNLKPAKLAGVMSEGMLLCAEDAEGSLSLMIPEKEMPSGAEIC